MRTEDGCIIQDCLNGKPEAFGMLVDKYKEGVYAFAYAQLRDFQDAQDVTQEVFLQAYRDLRSLRRWESFCFWIYRIAHRCCAQCFRTRSKRVDREFIDDQIPNLVDAPSLELYRADRLNESVREALDSLPEAYQEVLLLHYFGGMTSRDIAEALGVSPMAVLKRLSRARAQLKKEIVAMMGTAFHEQQLRTGFTFRIVESVKRIKIHPMPRVAGLPWGLALAMGIIITVLGLNPHMSVPSDTAIPSGLPLPAMSRVLETGEIPVDVLRVSEAPIIARKQGDGDDGNPVPPDPQNAIFMAPQGEEDTWVEKAEMPTTRNRLSTCVVDGIIYAIGGTDGAGLSTVEAYDSAKNAWVEKADMPTARYWLSTSVVDGVIYAMGGREDAPPWRAMATVEAYDPVEDRWTPKTDMPTERAAVTTCAVDGMIYAIGGFQGGNGPGLATVEAYDPSTDTWEEMAGMPAGRRFHTASVVDGKIYVIGGGEEADDWISCEKVAVYDPDRNVWEEMNGTMPSPRADHSASVVNGIIYTFGGASFPPGNQNGLAIVEAYDPAADSWEAKADMPTARMDLSTSAIGGRIYAIGGRTFFGGQIMSTVEAYDTGFVPPQEGSSIEPRGKLPGTWGSIRQNSLM